MAVEQLLACVAAGMVALATLASIAVALRVELGLGALHLLRAALWLVAAHRGAGGAHTRQPAHPLQHTQALLP